MTRTTRHLITTRVGQVHCREAGKPDAPAVIILHINQQSSALQLELMEELAPRLHAVAMDYPSHGMSDHIDGAPSIADYAECAAAVMSALAVDRFTSVGEATGAAVAMELGIRYASRIDRDTLLLMGEYFHYTALLDEYRQRLPRLVAAEVIPQARFCMAWEKAADLASRIIAFIERPR